jgi:hypothetical protein
MRSGMMWRTQRRTTRGARVRQRSHVTSEQPPQSTALERGEEESTSEFDGLAVQLRELRTALLEQIEALPETRLYRRTDRVGWTLKHELSSLAAGDEELVHILERLRSDDRPEAHQPLHLRRFRGEHMWAAQELRLTPLRAHLEATGQRAAAAIEAHAHDIADRPLAIVGRELATARDYLTAHLEGARSALERIRRVME